MTLSPLLSVQHLRVEANGQTLLAISDLTINRHEVLTIIGPNGAGKSTLLQTLACLREPVSGVFQFDGQTVLLNDPRLSFRRRLAVVFQEPLLFDVTVYENVASGLKLRGVAQAVIRERVTLWLDRLGIAHLTRRQARTLSGGEAQRTSLARAFVLEPDVLFLDEPFAALDPVTRESLIETFHRLQRETRVTTLLVTHDRLEALRLGDRVAVMDRGAILQIGSLEEVFSQPINETVASFVGIETILRGQIVTQSKGVAEVRVGASALVLTVSSLAVGTAVTLCLRLEEVTLFDSAAESVSSSARNHFPAIVQRIVPWGAAFKVHLDCGFPLAAFVTRPSIELLDLREGKHVAAAFKATAVHVIADE